MNHLEIPSLESGEKKSKKKKKSKKGNKSPVERFRFTFEEEVEGGVEEKEESLIESEEKTITNAVQMGRVFVEEVEKPRGRVRDEQAKLQNKITRGQIQGTLGGSKMFYGALKEQMAKEYKEHRARKNYSADIDKIRPGVESNVQTIEDLRKEFKRKHKNDGMQQDISMNDYLDAKYQIDLFDIRYRETEEGIVIESIDLVQVKSKNQDLSDVNQIHAAHADFVGRMLSSETLQDKLLEKEMSESIIKTNAYFEKQIAEAESDMEAGAFAAELFGEFILSHHLSMGSEDELAEERLNGVTPALLKLFFRKPESEDVYLHIVLREEAAVGTYSDKAEEEARQSFNKLQGWAGNSTITSEELHEANPDREPDKSIFEAAPIHSVVIHGKNRVEQSINQTGKGLTRN